MIVILMIMHSSKNFGCYLVVCEGKILLYNMGIVFMKSRLKIPSHPREFRLTLGDSVSPSEIPSHPQRFRLTLVVFQIFPSSQILQKITFLALI